MPDYLCDLDITELQGTDRLVLHTMATLDLGHADADSDAVDSVGEPGNNDPTYRSSAFAYGVSLAMETAVKSYIDADERRIHDIFNRTFRLSFQYSAGSPLMQSFFQLRIAQLLRAKYGEPALVKAAETAPFDPAKFAIPANHKGGRSLSRAGQRLPAIWNFYMSIAKNVNDPTAIRPMDKMKAADIDLLNTFGNKEFIALGIPYFMLPREIVYLKEGRPNKTTVKKKYRSDIREHSIEGRPTGNPEFNLVFTEMGIVLSAIAKLQPHQVPDLYLMTEIKEKLGELELLWQNRHHVPFLSPLPQQPPVRRI